MDLIIEKAKRRRDSRGYLVDFLKKDELPKKFSEFGQMYFVTFETPNAIRGNHYHKTKREWFMAASGKLQVELVDLKTREHKSFVFDGTKDEYERICIGPNIAHAFKNITDSAMMVNYSDKPYHFEDSDTYEFILIK